MKVEVLGTGCKSCDTLFENVVKALEKTGLTAQSQLEKTDDIDYFAKMGVFTTPGLVIEGELISSGQVLAEERIIAALKAKCKSL
jgi:small redox-active disulfide protein 2